MPPDDFNLTDGLRLPIRRPAGEHPAWNTLPRRRNMRARSFEYCAVLVLTVVASAIVFALASKPFWGEFRPVSAGVLSTSEFVELRGGAHCEVVLAFTVGTDQKTTLVEAPANCRSMPAANEQVTLLVDAEGNGTRILGHDHYLSQLSGLIFLIGLGATTMAFAGMVWTTRRYGLVKRLTRNRPWYEVEGLVTGEWTYDGPESFVMLVTDSVGKSRQLLVRCNGRRPNGLEPEAGSRLRMWLVADGSGNAVLRAPNGSNWILAKVSIPTDFELRALQI